MFIFAIISAFIVRELAIEVLPERDQLIFWKSNDSYRFIRFVLLAITIWHLGANSLFLALMMFGIGMSQNGQDPMILYLYGFSLSAYAMVFARYCTVPIEKNRRAFIFGMILINLINQMLTSFSSPDLVLRLYSNSNPISKFVSLQLGNYYFSHEEAFINLMIWPTIAFTIIFFDLSVSVYKKLR